MSSSNPFAGLGDVHLYSQKFEDIIDDV
uniref:Uncharacterized protein n=1 Tax=Heterorhabditis bacteriophora TaxID=37862 RepID=A0A1I7X1H9_HETBA